MELRDINNRSRDIANAAKHLLETRGICSYGMFLTEDDKELGYCYQKDDSFVFVNYRGEEKESPLMDDFERWVNNLGLDIYMHPIKLLQYNEYEMTYKVCNPSCEEYSSIYNEKDPNKFYIICSNGKCLPINMEYGYFEYIDKPQYIFLTHHQTDEIRNTDIYDRKCYDIYPYRSDVFFDKRTNEIWECYGFIKYKKYIIINGVAPCTIIYDESIAKVYKRDEDALFCRIGKYAYLIFWKSEIAYNIDTKLEKSIEDLDEYDNFDIGSDYLIKYRITSHAREVIIQEDEKYGQYEEWIPKHDVTNVVIYNQSLEVVRELYIPGFYDDIVSKQEKILLKCCVEGNYSSNYYYDINRPEYRKYDAITRKTYSVADIVEKQISDDIMIEEFLNSTKAYDSYISFNQDLFDDEDEVFNCRIKVRRENEWKLLGENVYSSIVLHCFKYRGETLWPTYLLAIRNRERHEYDLYANEIKLVDKGVYSVEAIKICQEGCRIIFSDREKFGIIGEGKIIVSLLEEPIEYYYDYENDKSIYVIHEGNAFGIIDNDGNTLLKCEFTMVKCYYDWYRNLYILISKDNINYSWARCDKDSFYIEKAALPDNKSIIKPSWNCREYDGDDEVIIQVNYNIQTGEFNEDEERFNNTKEGDYSEWTDEDSWDAMTDGMYGDYPGSEWDPEMLGF